MVTGRNFLMGCAAAALMAAPVLGKQTTSTQKTSARAEVIASDVSETPAASIEGSRQVKIIQGTPDPLLQTAPIAAPTETVPATVTTKAPMPIRSTPTKTATRAGGPIRREPTRLSEVLRQNYYYTASETTSVAAKQEPVADAPASVMPESTADAVLNGPSMGCADGSCSTGGCADGSCGSGSCGSCGAGCSCGEGCDCDDCCDGFWRHRTGASIELLYLRPTGVDMAHAQQENGVGGLGTVPFGRVGVISPNYHPGFRAGFSVALDSCSSIVAGYTQYRNHDSDSLVAPAGVVGGNISSLVLQPNTLNTGTSATRVDASYDIQFQFADLAYNRLLAGSNNFALNYTVGARYANLKQRFNQTGAFAQPTGNVQTNTNIDFDGAGTKFGLDARRRIGQGGLSVYGNSFISVMFGESSSRLSQINTTTTSVLATNNFAEHRVLPILEYEIGASWASPGERLRLSAGYYTAFWFNATTTAEYIQAVQTSDYVHIGRTINFNGLTSRVEYRF